MNHPFSGNLQDTMDYFNKALSIDRNFDIVYRVLRIGGKNACMYTVDGFVKDEVLEKILSCLFTKKPEDMPSNAHDFSKELVAYTEVGLTRDADAVITQLLSGITCLFIDGYQDCITIECRTYPVRSVEEPEKDRVLRGSRDGFVETLVFNTALIRRRIRDPHLINEITQVGNKSKTDVAICYIDDRVDQDLLERVKTRIKNIEVDALTMNQESLAECLYQYKWINPFPKFKFSERPDTAAACLLEGNIIILVDNSPAAMILPSSIFDIIEEADDYYFPPLTGTYLRLTRFGTSLIALLLTPIFLLLMQNPQWIPDWLAFIQFKETVSVPLILQLLILEFAIDGLKLASLNTPSMLTTPLSVIAALVVGDFSVSSGWFNAETMLYMAFVVLSNYTQSSLELGYALKFLRIILLVLTSLFNVWGFAAGILICLIALFGNKTIAGKSYLYPLFPFDGKKIGERFFRARIPHSSAGEHGKNNM